MQHMSTTPVISLSEVRDRSARVARAIDARRSLRDGGADRRARSRSEGRAWVNGSELGGARAAFAHLAESYD
jgi:hypothetical protein